MNVIVKNALRLVGTANNSTKYLRSMWNMGNQSNDRSRDSTISPILNHCELEKLKNSQAKKEMLCWNNSNTAVKKVSSINTAVATLAENLQNNLDAEDGEEFLKVGIFNVSLDIGQFILKTQEKDKSFTLSPKVVIKREDELIKRLQYGITSRKKKPSTLKVGKFNVSLDSGKLILKTENNDETFIFNHKLDIKVYKKSTDNLKDKITTENKVFKKNLNLPVNSNYTVTVDQTKLTLKTKDSDKTLLYKPHCNYISSEQWAENGAGAKEKTNEPLQIIGHHHVLVEGGQVTVKTKKSDEVFVFDHTVDIESCKELAKNLTNKIAAEKKDKKISSKIGKFEAVLESGETSLKTQDDDETIVLKYAVHLIVDIDGTEPIINITRYLRAAIINYPDE